MRTKNLLPFLPAMLLILIFANAFYVPEKKELHIDTPGEILLAGKKLINAGPYFRFDQSFSTAFNDFLREPGFHPNTVNSVLGDVSYTKAFGVEPDANSPEEVRIKTHLSYVIQLLKYEETSHLNDHQKQNRAMIISLLEAYKEAGQFPKNHHFENRRPVFIDRDGNLCAVGYLVAQTEGLEAAQKINRDHKFDYIQDIDPGLITGWLAKNGLTKTEAAMIQPAYGGTYKETIKENEIELSYAVGSSLLAGAEIGITTYSLLAGDDILTNRRATAFNAALGLASLTLGIINLDNSYSEVVVSNEDPIICGFCYTRYEYTYKNPARTNFSIANIVLGGASALFNGIRFFKTKQQEEVSRLNISATQLYEPATESIAPGLSVSMRF